MRLFAIAAVVVAIGLGGAAAACGGGEGPDGKLAEQAGEDLRSTRDDGTQFRLPADVRAWCGNELLSSETESSGVIRVELEGCDPGDEVRVELDDVVLGSESFDAPTVRADGSVVADIGDEPRRIGG